MKNKTKLNFLDKAISVLSPRAAFERVAWREGLRNYDSGRTDRINSGWSPVNAPAESVNQSQRDILRARARDLERNADIAEAIISAYERNVVGSGITVQAKPLKKNGKEDKKLGQKMEDIFFDWCQRECCDITNELCFEEMQELAVRRMVVDGGVLFIMSDNPYDKSAIPFMLQMREVDEIDGNKFSYKLENGNRIINGIEVNEYNKPVAYWLKTITPDGLQIGDSKRVPAERVIYMRKKKRPSQIREVSKLSSTAERVRDVNEYSEAVSIKERVLACLSVFIKKQLPTTGAVGRGSVPMTSKDVSSGYEMKTLAPGMITELQPGDDVSSVNPAGQASNAKEFITSQQRLIASGQGLSYEAASRDMSQVNYSSARQGLIEDRKTYENMQLYIKRHLCSVVYREVITQAVLSKKLEIPDFFANKERYLYHSWIAPGMSWIDPLKEIKANETALLTNQTTLAQICAERGQDWREVVNQRAEEINYIDNLIGNKNEGGENVNNEKTAD